MEFNQKKLVNNFSYSPVYPFQFMTPGRAAFFYEKQVTA